MTETVREQTPVIVAVGETIDRPDQLEDAKEPVDLMVEALRACEEDAGARLIESLNRIDVIGVVSWLYENPAALLCERLGLDPARGRKRGMGGEKPIRLIDEAARAVAAGEQEMIAVVGGEAMNSYRKARRADVRLDWTPRADRMAAWGDLDDTTLGVPEAVQKLGVQRPIHVYPFFENALQAKRGQTPTEGMCKSAELWARFSDAAAQNPYAWRRDALSARDIATITDENRMVSFPYVKFMAANDSVNQAGAVIVCSLAAARRLGVPDQRLIFFRDAAAANEPANFLKRARFDACPAMETTLETLARRADGGGAFDLIELYSCFPVVPKMARRILCAEGMKTDAPPSVVGGLTFFGGPLNNYMTHAACAMVRKLRDGAGETALLYGQGGVMTKHHGLVLSASPMNYPPKHDVNLQEETDARRGATPALVRDHVGPARIETYGAYYAPDGGAHVGVVIARAPDGRRLIAGVSSDDEATLETLTSFDDNAIGLEGETRLTEDGALAWTM